MKTEELKNILDSEDGERALCRFIKENPFVLRESLQFMGHPTRVVEEFPIGNDYRADFVVLAPFSGAFEIKLIEIEPPSSPFFNKNGSLSQRANKALEQVNSWNTYIKKNQKQFLKDIERYAQEKDLIRDHTEPMTCSAGWSIHHPRMSLYFSYDIIMGRRASLTDAQLEKKADFLNNNNVALVTSDRLFQGTEKIDRNPEIYL
ncbi:DUF4263 domain-containing protein [Coraliomargarita algicola]|uniref:DUF4263 domain-containing protein n=1 Tax=Coraliomargarita algicola TaxID=3092156 RepID=A0ABZ0RJG1_9BACT|nr:Shedu anti-phage system protein SduA domain-containing protein [Coraliomargarita sp. J2-16]WPJ95394.1 DUF4263 domain-containing protein [Coraliomargarita sp. J2-16]